MYIYISFYWKYFSGLDRIIGELLKKLQKDLEVDESITSEAAKAFFTLEGGHVLGELC